MPFDTAHMDQTVAAIRAMLLREDVSGVVLYRGRSAINGAPIVVVATAWAGSANSKTGNMVQTYILADALHPVEAVQTGADAAVCGACVHRPTLHKTAGAARCYVNLAFGANSVAKGLLSGAYIDATWMTPADLAQLGEDLAIRIGTYGDGAAAPFTLWQAFTSRARTWTGYTHQWRAFPAFAALCMASVDSEAEAAEAHAMGWRTFRVADPVAWRKMPGEGLCPASYEAGKRTTCVDCGLCSGTAGKGRASIVIPDHSSAGDAAKRRAGIMPPRVVIRRTPAAA